MLSHLERKGKVLIDHPIRLNFWRAHTDNDGIKGRFGRHWEKWDKALLQHYYFNLFDMQVQEQSDRVTVTVLGRMTADSLYAGFVCTIVYEIYAGGTVLVSVKGEPYGKLPNTLPRIGLILPMEKAFDHCHWLGRGPRESYPDSKAAAPMGCYRLPVESLNVIYDYPQETGNHENTLFATLESADGRSISVVGSEEFSFSYHDFSLEDLENAAHKNELQRSEDKNYLYIDYKMRGLGSESCGPPPEEAYELHPHTFSFAFVLAPTDAEHALELSRKSFAYKTEPLSDTYIPTPIQKIPQIADCDI